MAEGTAKRGPGSITFAARRDEFRVEEHQRGAWMHAGHEAKKLLREPKDFRRGGDRLSDGGSPEGDRSYSGDPHR